MKLRRPTTTFKPSVYNKTKKSGFWDFDTTHFTVSTPGKLTELTNHSRPSGKGRFGKRALSFTIDYGGHSNDSNSNDSGVGCDFNSSESQLSWCSSEDSHFSRSSSISNISSASIPQFPIPSCRKRVVFEDSTKEKLSADLGLEANTAGGLLDTNINSGKSMVAEKVPFSNMRMSPDSTDSSLSLLGSQVTTANQMKTSFGSHNPNSSSPTSTVSPVPLKRPRFSFPTPSLSSGAKNTGLKLRNQNQNGRSLGKRLPLGTAPTLTSTLAPVSRDGRAQLQILAQPEEQHRARYQTEGSRGAIKDRKGNGFPSVKLIGYDKPATLQIFIGTDQGKVNPHMFYQACKVTGKSSTPCIEKKIEGTILIEIEFEPSKDMVISCDCVGILKERNVDVEQRFPFHHASQSRKKSTKCRMIFRTTIMNSSGLEETLQISSVPILCTQPPGLPEICKQSLYDCPAKGGLELFVVGKNFLKDTKIVFHEEDDDGRSLWECTTEPLKDYLQQNHLICPVPPYRDQTMTSPAECKVTIVSGGKHSEPHRFTYLPNISAALYGIPATSVCDPTNPSSQSVIQETLSRSLSHDDQLLTMDLQTMGQLSQQNDITVSNIGTSATELSISSHSNGTSPHSQSSVGSSGIHQQLGPVSTPLDPLQPLTFNNNITTPITSAQERCALVVHELQSILEQQSVQQNQHEKAVADMMSATTMMSIKPEITYTNVSMSQNCNINVPASVPVDLQFPTDNVQTGTSAVPATFAEQAICGPQFSTAPISGCINSDGVPQLITRSGSIDANTDTKLLTELMPNSQLSLPSTTSFIIPGAVSSISMNSINSDNGTMAASVTSSQLMVENRMRQGLVKVEPQPLSTPNVCMNMNTVVVSNQQTPIVSSNVAVNPANFMGGELQPHQGTFANALTQLSDNELIDYINPSYLMS